jgi:uncharacterized protein YlxP (DUF503 family)
MIVVLLDLDIHLPGVGSLKEKRGLLKSAIAALRRDLNVSVAEVEHQNLWQRAGLGVAIAATSEVGGRKVAQQVEAILGRDPRLEVVGVNVDVVAGEP